MASEIERKFLIVSSEWKTLPAASSSYITQGYIPQDKRNETRLFVQFKAASIGGFAISLNNNDHDMTFPASGGTLRDIVKLKAYNARTGEITLGNNVEGRLRTEIHDSGIQDAELAVKEYRGPGKTEECEGNLDIHDARYALNTFGENIVFKRRILVPYEGYTWQVDVYDGPAKGLITADIEVPTASAFRQIRMLPGTGADVTNVAELRNKALGSGNIPAEYRLHL